MKDLFKLLYVAMPHCIIKENTLYYQLYNKEIGILNFSPKVALSSVVTSVRFDFSRPYINITRTLGGFAVTDGFRIGDKHSRPMLTMISPKDVRSYE